MHITKSISVIMLSTLFSLTAITSYADDTEKSKNMVFTVKQVLSNKQNNKAAVLCQDYPLCDVDIATKDNEWPALSVVNKQ
jgi:hypothetical protein